MPYTMEEMHNYGYHWDQMVPLLWVEAFSFISADPDNGQHVFLLYKDGTESRMKSIQELDFHKGMFGVERKTYEQYLEKNQLVRKQLDAIERTEETIELAMETSKGSFTISNEQKGYRFAFYDKELLLTDQGLFPYQYSLAQTVNRLMCDHFIEMEHCRFTDYDSLMVKVEERFGPKPLDMVHVELKRDSWQLPDYRIQSSDDAVYALQNLIKNLDKEAFVVLNLSTKNQVINASVCTVGTMNSTLVSPGEVFRTAICSGSHHVIVMHNHPSGDCTPSREDDEVTRRLATAGHLLGIKVLDHIVVGGDDLYSYYQDRSALLDGDELIERSMALAEEGTYVSRKEKVAQITEKLQAAVKDFCNGEQYTAYLDTIAKFHNYSFNNCLLIAMQRPGASLVAGYNAWNSKFERHVMKGEKGIQILSPIWKEVENEKTGDLERRIVAYKPAYVFDVTQTEGKELPSLTRNLTEAVTDFETKKSLLVEIASVPVEFRETEDPEIHGYYHLIDKNIVIRPDMSEAQTLKTMIHEIAHSEMHVELRDQQTRQSKEIEAESVAYVVCKYFQLDTSDYSFGYISGWSSNREVSELQESMKKVNHVASDIIGRLEKAAEKRGLLEKTETKEKGEVKHEKTVRKTSNYCCTA